MRMLKLHRSELCDFSFHYGSIYVDIAECIENLYYADTEATDECLQDFLEALALIAEAADLYDNANMNLNDVMSRHDAVVTQIQLS